MTAPAPGLARIVFALVVAQIYAGIAVNCSGVFAPVVTRALGVAPQMLGLYAGLLAGTAVFSGFLLNGAVARYGGVRTLQLALGAMAAGFPLAASGVPMLVLASALLVGAASGVGTAASAQLMAVAAPKERLGILFAIKQSGVPVAIGLNGLLIPAMLLVFEWRVSVLAVGVAALPVLGLLQTLRAAMDGQRRADAPLRGAGIFDPARRVMARRDLKTLAIATFLLSGVQGVFISYTVSYVNLELGASLVVAGLALTISQVATVLVRLACGWWADKVGDPMGVIGWLALGAFVTAFILAFATPAWSTPAIVAAVVLFSVTAGGWMGIYQAALVRYADPDQIPASAAGTQAFLFAGGTTLVPLFALVAAQAGSYAVAYAVFGLVSLAACGWIFARRRAGAEAAPA